MKRKHPTSIFFILFLLVIAIGFEGCSESGNTDYYFELLDKKKTGLVFVNSLQQSEEMNIMSYMYFYNGGGVGVGDFNNDGMQDIYFTSNQSENRLFLNIGNLTFKDVTTQANAAGSPGWSTGVSVVDINNDGMLDIYVCQVGDFRKIKGTNQLMICKGITDGIPFYQEEAALYGLNIKGFSTQAVFFDYDKDGDLDMFLLNHSVHENGTFGERKTFLNKTHHSAGDKLFQNNNGVYVDVSDKAGILGLVIGYGLGVSIADINNDGWPDIYVGNDFHENDYLYINQRDGTFKESLDQQIKHTSKFSMGVDIGDINNDGYNEIISLDMLPEDPLILKKSQGDDNHTLFDFKISYGYSPQFARNNLQLNNGDGTFSEIAPYLKVHSTDWSWSSLFIDFDNDGNKDLFITNGIPRRMNDLDYINFREENEDHKWKTQANRMDKEDIEIIEEVPRSKLMNKFFINPGQLEPFIDIELQIKNSEKSYSNGAAYADFDSDGDIDIVVNNIDDYPFLYKNLVSERKKAQNHYLNFSLHGSPLNQNGIGAKIIVFSQGKRFMYENFPVRGFQSSVSQNMFIAFQDTATLDSVVLIWPDDRYEKISDLIFNTDRQVKWNDNLPIYNFAEKPNREKYIIKDVTQSSGMSYVHKENNFPEFDREGLIPFMISTEGPALAIGDINSDGLDDVFFGSSKKNKSSIYFQNVGGTFYEKTSKAILNDSTFEDVDAAFKDIDGDGDADLIVAGGGNEFWGTSEYLKQRYYLNDGRGNFYQRKTFPGAYLTASSVIVEDFNGDGLPDVFFTARAVPNNFGLIPSSYYFENQGGGNFLDRTDNQGDDLKLLGLVTDAASIDFDGDGDKDIVLALEWSEIRVLVNNSGSFQVKSVSSQTGLWNFVLPHDFDNDGDIDIVAGNWGLNTKLTASSVKPLRLYVDDFDKNGQIEQLLTYYVKDKEVPVASYNEIVKRIPTMKKKFLLADDFAKATIKELIGDSNYKTCLKYKVTNLENMYFENIGGGNFIDKKLPNSLQFSCMKSGIVIDDKQQNASSVLLLAGNFHSISPEIGWSDASYGSLVSLNAKGFLSESLIQSLHIDGQIRRILPIKTRDSLLYLFVQNNGPAKLMSIDRMLN